MNGSVTERVPDRFREVGFALFLILGIGIFALGLAFLILSVPMNTTPPAPYMSPWHKRLLIGGSVVVTMLGLFIVRFAGRLIGW